MTGLLALAIAAGAWEHAGSKVAFIEYREGIVEELRDKHRPYFLLFSAEWCHWCHEFGEKTLSEEMEVNGLIAQTLIGLNEDGEHGALVDTIVTYFSAMGEVFEERLWEGENWEFTERYVPYLRAVDSYLSGPKLAAHRQ